MLYTSDYSRRYHPPAPIAEIQIWNPEQPDQEVTTSVLIDSGSDGTILPKDLLEEIGASYLTTMQMRWGNESLQEVDMFLISIGIGDYTAAGVWGIAGEAGSEPIIGRDVLNQFVVTLNGLALEVTLKDSL